MKKASLPTKDTEKKVDVTNEENTIDVTESVIKEEDFTKYVIPRISKKYVASIKRVFKEGRNYTIIFNEEYTAFQQSSRKCKDIFGVMWYAKIATEEKQKGYSFEYWKKWLDKEKIIWDGQHIPEYLWTKEQYKKYNVKEDKIVKQGV